MDRITITTAALAAVMFSGAMSSVPAFAEDINTSQNSQMLNYAPQESMNTDRFSQFDFGAAPDGYTDDHELNDSWLGMSAYSSDGKYLGYVEDALLNHNGEVAELIVGSENSQISVQLGSDYAELSHDKVTLSLSKKEYARIINGANLALLD